MDSHFLRRASAGFVDAAVATAAPLPPGVSSERMAQLELDAVAFSLAVPPEAQFSLWSSPMIMSTVIIIALVLMLLRHTTYILYSLAMIDADPEYEAVDLGSSPYKDDEPEVNTSLLVRLDDNERDADEGLGEHPAAEEEEVTDVESILTINVGQVQLTTNIRATLTRLRKIGGYRSFWRGAHIAVLYRVLFRFVGMLLSTVLAFVLYGAVNWSPLAIAIFTFGIVPREAWLYVNFLQLLWYTTRTGTVIAFEMVTKENIIYLVVVLILVSVHPTWTYAMVALPSANDWYSRLIPRQRAKVLVTPAILSTLAQHAATALPLIATSLFFKYGAIRTLRISWLADEQGYFHLSWNVVVIVMQIAVPIILLVLSSLLALPARTVLTRVEVAMLSEDERTIVPFDRAALIQDVDLTTYPGARTVLVRACRSLTRADIWRLTKLWAKVTALQSLVVLPGLLVLVAQICYFSRREDIALFFRSTTALLRLAAILDAQNPSVEPGSWDLVTFVWLGLKFGIKTPHVPQAQA